jgi:putative nucleotidyltransferase with HDIG domain
VELVDKILKHPKFQRYLKLNSEEEVNRTLCHHDLQHALDVARVAYIISMEKDLKVEKEIIYVTALLHDIAKWKQYQEKVDHALEGANLAEEILRDIGLEKSEAESILEAIRSHRIKGEKSSALSELLYAGDKACRLCIDCEGIKECDRFQKGEQPVLKY